MQETLLQDRFLLPYLCDTLGYREVKPNTVSNSLIIEEDLAAFVAGTPLNAKNYAALLRRYGGDRKQLLAELIAVIQERSASSRNMALFLNANKSVTLRDVRLHLFYTSDSAIHGDEACEVPAEDCFRITEVVLKLREAARAQQVVEL